MKNYTVNNSVDLFQLVLQLSDPWRVIDIYYEDNIEMKESELHIVVGYAKGAKFKDKDGLFYKPFGTVEKTWRHLNFFQHRCYLHCNVPRIHTQAGETKMVEVPWSRKHHGFTLLFESVVKTIIEKEMPVAKAADLEKEYAQRKWTVFNFWNDKTLKKDTAETTTIQNFDGTSVKKENSYAALAIELKTSRLNNISESQRVQNY